MQARATEAGKVKRRNGPTRRVPHDLTLLFSACPQHTRVKSYLVRANDGGTADRPRGRNWLFVAIHTDEGIVGYGEGGGWPEIVAAGVREIAPLLIGEDPSPLTDCFVGDDDAALSQEFLNVAIAETKAEVAPNCVRDYFLGIAKALVRQQRSGCLHVPSIA